MRGMMRWWRGFRRSRLLPAVVLVCIIAAAAGAFAASYTYAMANPRPHDIPTGLVVAAKDETGFVPALESELGDALALRRYADAEQAREALEEQEIFAVVAVSGGSARVTVASASGVSVAELLSRSAPQVGERVGARVTVDDLKPLQAGDPRGLTIFYISLATVILGFVGAIQLHVHARLTAGEHIAFTAAYSALGGWAVVAVVDGLLHALRLPVVESWAILAATMFTAGMVFSMFNVLFGRWAMLPTWGILVLLGNPSSGGAVAWPLLPTLLGVIGHWLPPGAAVNAQYTAVYFQEHQHPFPFLVLGGWALVSSVVFYLVRHRRDVVASV